MSILIVICNALIFAAIFFMMYLQIVVGSKSSWKRYIPMMFLMVMGVLRWLL